MPLIVYAQPRDDDTTDAIELPAGTRRLGAAAGLEWARLPGGSAVPDGARAPTPGEIVDAKRELPAVVQLKASTRRRITEEVGDPEDLLADQARQIEALTALSVRLAQVVLGGQTLDPALQQDYLDRITPIAQALDDGSLTLRGDMEGADDMLGKVMGRADQVNGIIAGHYLPRLDDLLG